MWTIICLGKSAEVYGPFDNPETASRWLGRHQVNRSLLCPNGISYDEHHLVIAFAPFCRICGTALFYDRDNHPVDTGFCYYHNEISDQVEHDLI